MLRLLQGTKEQGSSFKFIIRTNNTTQMTSVPLEQRWGGALITLLATALVFLTIAFIFLIPIGGSYFFDYIKHDGIEFTQLNCTAVNAMVLIQTEKYQLNVEVQYNFGDQIYNTVFVFGEYKTQFEANMLSKHLLMEGQFPCYVHPNEDVPRLDSYSVADEFAPGLTMFILGITFFIVSVIICVVLDRSKEARKQREAVMAKKRADLEKGAGSGSKTSSSAKQIDIKVSNQYQAAV